MELTNKSETFYLWWENPNIAKRTPAGVAFYDEKFGEYRLKIDQIPDDQVYYLKPTSSDNGRIDYQVDKVLKRSGRFLKRVETGDGYSDKDSQGEIYIDFGGFGKRLILTFNKAS